MKRKIILLMLLILTLLFLVACGRGEREPKQIQATLSEVKKLNQAIETKNISICNEFSVYLVNYKSSGIFPTPTPTFYLRDECFDRLAITLNNISLCQASSDSSRQRNGIDINESTDNHVLTCYEQFDNQFLDNEFKNFSVCNLRGIDKAFCEFEVKFALFLENNSIVACKDLSVLNESCITSYTDSEYGIWRCSEELKARCLQHYKKDAIKVAAKHWYPDLNDSEIKVLSVEKNFDSELFEKFESSYRVDIFVRLSDNSGIKVTGDKEQRIDLFRKRDAWLRKKLDAILITLPKNEVQVSKKYIGEFTASVTKSGFEKLIAHPDIHNILLNDEPIENSIVDGISVAKYCEKDEDCISACLDCCPCKINFESYNEGYIKELEINPMGDCIGRAITTGCPNTDRPKVVCEDNICT